MRVAAFDTGGGEGVLFVDWDVGAAWAADGWIVISQLIAVEVFGGR